MANTPETINSPKAVPAPPRAWLGGTIRGTRQSVLNAIAASALTDARKAVLVEEVGLIPESFELIRVDFHRQNYQSGANCTYTVSEL